MRNDDSRFASGSFWLGTNVAPPASYGCPASKRASWSVASARAGTMPAAGKLEVTAAGNAGLSVRRRSSRVYQTRPVTDSPGVG